MIYLATTSYANNREIAQGETLPIFITILPAKSEIGLDRVWAETDEGYTTDALINPPYSQILQLVFTSEDTLQFTPGEHHVRIWARDETEDYVLLEFMMSVNPKFPFDKDTLNKDYTYQGPNKVSYTTDKNAELVNQPSYKVKQAYIAKWQDRVIEVECEADLPTSDCQIGDIAIVTKDNPLQYFMCIGVEPVKWLRMANDPFDTHDLIVASKDFVHLDCQPTFESEVK